MPRLRTALAAALLVGTLAACSSDDGQLAGSPLTEPYAVPDSALTDTEGDQFSLATDTNNPLTLVFFGYTNCPDICNTVMANLASAMTRLDDADRERVQVVFVTTDPARDDEAALRDYLDRFDPTFQGLTGDLDTITDMGRDLGIAVDKGKRLPSGGYEVTHSTQVIGVDAMDQAPIVWTEGTSASEYASDIHILLGDA